MHSFNIQANFEAVEITRNLDCTSTCMNIVMIVVNCISEISNFPKVRTLVLASDNRN